MQKLTNASEAEIQKTEVLSGTRKPHTQRKMRLRRILYPHPGMSKIRNAVNELKEWRGITTGWNSQTLLNRKWEVKTLGAYKHTESKEKLTL